MRDPGAHMAVGADGQFAGSLSGGCIENAVVAEALDALKTNKPRITRFGAGSRYIDIKLPCGGGLDIHFLPLHDMALVGDCLNAIGLRRPFSLILPVCGGDPQYLPGWRPLSADRAAGYAVVGHWPAPRLLIIGHGGVVGSLDRLAAGMDLEASVLTSDPALVDRLSGPGRNIRLLRSVRDVSAVRGDPWTAIIFLFHDHDWEGHLMAHALDQPYFYLGAMGGRKAHSARQEALRILGAAEAKIARIHAPIGLFHSARDPDSLALSALAEIIQCYQSYDFADHTA